MDQVLVLASEEEARHYSEAEGHSPCREFETTPLAAQERLEGSSREDIHLFRADGTNLVRWAQRMESGRHIGFGSVMKAVAVYD